MFSQLMMKVAKQNPSLSTRGAMGRARKSREVVLDRNTLSEVRRYANPSVHLHRVVQAMLLLLGDDETATKALTTSQHYI